MLIDGGGVRKTVINMQSSVVIVLVSTWISVDAKGFFLDLFI